VTCGQEDGRPGTRSVPCTLANAGAFVAPGSASPESSTRFHQDAALAIRVRSISRSLHVHQRNASHAMRSLLLQTLILSGAFWTYSSCTRPLHEQACGAKCATPSGLTPFSEEDRSHTTLPALRFVVYTLSSANQHHVAHEHVHALLECASERSEVQVESLLHGSEHAVPRWSGL
jgi:hypothetical protein